jgi:GMP synthase (glutamine-hydrolysing)
VGANVFGRDEVLVVQHVACETLGTIGLALGEHGLKARHVRIYEGDEVPPGLGDGGGLVIMGGPMGVGDAPRLPHLAREMRLIEAALEAGRPVLGVCLGSQLVAHVLGGRVYPGPRKEIGWHAVRLSEAGLRDPLWSGSPREFPGFHWHGDIFDLPAGAESLASSDLTACQAFRSGASAYGILFHMEVTEPLIDGMAASFPGELAEAGGSPEQLRRGAVEHLGQLSSVGAGIFGGWARLVRRGPDPQD